MGARNREVTGLSYQPARLHRLAKSIPWNRFLGSLKVKKYRLRDVRKGTQFEDLECSRKVDNNKLGERKIIEFRKRWEFRKIFSRSSIARQKKWNAHAES
jgi:hypothetical protein